jgi:hypothetical protein
MTDLSIHLKPKNMFVFSSKEFESCFFGGRSASFRFSFICRRKTILFYFENNASFGALESF